MWAHTWKAKPIIARKARRQEPEVAGHSASPVRKRRQLEGCWCPNQTFLFPHKHMHTAVHMWRSENKFAEVALLPPCRFRGSNCSPQVWWQAPLPTELLSFSVS